MSIMAVTKTTTIAIKDEAAAARVTSWRALS